jgi:hypothetical protein
MDMYDTLHLGDHEYGSDKMTDLARLYFHRNPDCQFLEVWEHGGWYLGFRRDLSIYSTANDKAVLDSGPRPQRWSGREERR